MQKAVAWYRQNPPANEGRFVKGAGTASSPAALPSSRPSTGDEAVPAPAFAIREFTDQQIASYSRRATELGVPWAV